jgi:quercetin dioxygenase-like cupin family protein
VEPAGLKRIVTEVDASGRSVVAAHGPPPTVLRSGEGWIAEEWVAVPQQGARDAATERWRLAPPAGGLAFRLVEFAPAGRPGATSERHVTATVDYVVVLRGTVWLRLDDEEVELGPGDCVVQQGATHSWENRGSEPCVIAAVLASTEPR